MKEHSYMAFLQEAKQFIPQERIYTDELRRLAWGTDAGFYRLIPQIVIRSKDEDEVSQLLKLASRHGLPVTFRAAGTSLSGQAISDSILIVAGKNWEKYSISADYEQITLQPGIIGQRVNELLAPYGRKFAPDPASVKSAMVGGIVMNNASGMNCGTHANSDKVLVSARIILMDGTLLDTGNPVSRASFEVSHRDFIRRICELRDEIRTKRKTGRTHPLQIFHQKCNRAQSVALRPFRRPIRNHCPPHGRFRRYTGVPFGSDDED